MKVAKRYMNLKLRVFQKNTGCGKWAILDPKLYHVLSGPDAL